MFGGKTYLGRSELTFNQQQTMRFSIVSGWVNTSTVGLEGLDCEREDACVYRTL